MCADYTDQNFPSYFKKIYKIQIFITIFRFTIKKCIHLSTNKPSIGALVVEIAFMVWRKYFENSTFVHRICSHHVKSFSIHVMQI